MAKILFFLTIFVLIDANNEQGMVSVASSEDDIIIVGGCIDQSGAGSTDLVAQGTVQLLLSCHLPVLSVVLVQRG